jgi:hypothetical protein
MAAAEVAKFAKKTRLRAEKSLNRVFTRNPGFGCFRGLRGNDKGTSRGRFKWNFVGIEESFALKNAISSRSSRTSMVGKFCFMPRYRVFSREEVAQHCVEDDCWVIVCEDVFDLTPFVVQSQSGREFARLCAGRELSVDELPQSLQTQRVISRYLLGKLDTFRPFENIFEAESIAPSSQTSHPKFRDILDDKDHDIALLKKALAASERRYRELQAEVGELMGNLDDVAENLLLISG